MINRSTVIQITPQIDSKKNLLEKFRKTIVKSFLSFLVTEIKKGLSVFTRKSMLWVLIVLYY